MIISSTGVLKTYVFETEDSDGDPITYLPSDVLYVSDNGILTNEHFVVDGVTGWMSGYQVARVGTDEHGDFLIVANSF